MASKHPAFGRGARPLKCRECGALRADVGYISARGLCVDCGEARQRENVEQIVAGSGPYYDEYVSGLVDFVRELESR